ncbi:MULTISPECIES: hypothetical protein [Citrobacter freundii complex]|uniref:hypothetical protein n=1 Tax=Citrobacter freundii complex TaxID=1344959 RepID=UPI001D2A8D92|nr:hypothetical protein [Citrobacter portucalensis]EET7319304.1 hypothetical protein [Escherichia coli]ELE2066162.1 hypothetical protein [Citrobacter freundii]WFZ31917.1 hypothetical protein NFK62_25345 [Citrobacter portucalensis]WFZ36824.1 hypothetical protein NFK63_25365 [Citrobacter portucalensis]
MLSAWRTPVIAVTLALLSYVLIKGYNAYSDHVKYVKGLETDNKTLQEDNDNLDAQKRGLSVALQQQQEQNEELRLELQRRADLQAESNKKESDLEEQLSKQKQETADAISNLTKQLQKAGLRNLRLPDGVIRMQRERAEEVNRRANRRDKGSEPTKAGSQSVPTVPDS